MEQTSIKFVNNKYKNKLIDIAEQYNQPYPFCLFQYIAMNSNTLRKELTIYYMIYFKNNYILYTGESPSQNSNCSLSFCHFISHCKWLPSAAF